MEEIELFGALAKLPSQFVGKGALRRAHHAKARVNKIGGHAPLCSPYSWRRTLVSAGLAVGYERCGSRSGRDDPRPSCAM